MKRLDPRQRARFSSDVESRLEQIIIANARKKVGDALGVYPPENAFVIDPSGVFMTLDIPRFLQTLSSEEIDHLLESSHLIDRSDAMDIFLWLVQYRAEGHEDQLQTFLNNNIQKIPFKPAFRGEPAFSYFKRTFQSVNAKDGDITSTMLFLGYGDEFSPTESPLVLRPDSLFSSLSSDFLIQDGLYGLPDFNCVPSPLYRQSFIDLYLSEGLSTDERRDLLFFEMRTNLIMIPKKDLYPEDITWIENGGPGELYNNDPRLQFYYAEAFDPSGLTNQDLLGLRVRPETMEWTGQSYDRLAEVWKELISRFPEEEAHIYAGQ